jgi:hypothetical protein
MLFVGLIVEALYVVSPVVKPKDKLYELLVCGYWYAIPTVCIFI